jgi:hypothetical protein
VQAFTKINAAADRQKIIELAKQLSTPGRVGPDTELRAGKKFALITRFEMKEAVD